MKEDSSDSTDSLEVIYDKKNFEDISKIDSDSEGKFFFFTFKRL